MIKKNNFLIIISISLISAVLISAYQADKKIINLFNKQNITTKKKSSLKNSNEEVWITVFIHGMLSHMVRRPTIKRFLSIFNDETDGTLYQKATAKIRASDYFQDNQPVQSLGLKKINIDSEKNKPVIGLAKIFNELYKTLYKRKKENNHYYTYGWNGLVSSIKRYEASNELYEQLTKKIKSFKKKGINLKIRIIGYSHGGNIALHLGTINKKNNGNLSINELILLGVPIHNGIDYLVCNPCFKKIYNLYSNADRVQKLDILCKGSLFSRRKFENRKDFQSPKKLKQIRVKIMRNRTTKKEWPSNKDPRKNFDNPRIISGSSNLLRSISPSHGEWWFFGWTHRGYRRHFPLMPMSTLSLIPTIINAVEQYGDKNDKNFIVDMRPEQAAILVKGEHSTTIAPLLSKRKLLKLKSLAYKYAHKIITPEEYKNRVDEAIKQAKLKL